MIIQYAKYILIGKLKRKIDFQSLYFRNISSKGGVQLKFFSTLSYIVQGLRKWSLFVPKIIKILNIL